MAQWEDPPSPGHTRPYQARPGRADLVLQLAACGVMGGLVLGALALAVLACLGRLLCGLSPSTCRPARKHWKPA